MGLEETRESLQAYIRVGWKAVCFSSHSLVGGIFEYRKLFSIILGPSVGLIVLLSAQGGLDEPKVARMASILVWMALWWLTEAVPAPITSLLPLALFPMTGIMYADDVTKAYWNDTVVLFFGSFIVSLAIERWSVHRRLALKLLLMLESHNKDPRILLLGFIVCTGVLSMFMSNTATSIMMVPMAVAVLHKVRLRSNLGAVEMETVVTTPSNRPAEDQDDMESVDLNGENDAHPDMEANLGAEKGVANIRRGLRFFPSGRFAGLEHEPLSPQFAEFAAHTVALLERQFSSDGRDPGSEPPSPFTPRKHLHMEQQEEEERDGREQRLHKGPETGRYQHDSKGPTVSFERIPKEPTDDSKEEGRQSPPSITRASSRADSEDAKLNVQLADMDDPVSQYCRAIVLGIAYAASIGGMGSLTASSPNLILAGVFRHMFPEAPRISFFDWLGFGLPLALILMVLLWMALCFCYCPPNALPDIKHALDRSVLELEYLRLGPIRFAEKAVLLDFLILSILWVTRSPGGGIKGWGSLFENDRAVGDGTASALMAILLFVVPARSGKPWQMLMNWETCRTMPWDIVLLLGGGFALSAGVTASGLAAWLGAHMSSLHNIPPLLLSPAIALSVTFATEFASNNATATVLLPLLAGLALSTDRHPLLLMLPATLACSLAFMLPVATASNAVAYSTGFLRMRHLLFPGLFLNLAGVLLISIDVPTLGYFIFGVLEDPMQYPWYVSAKLANTTTLAP